jgi:predicted  nucleic acid-binding Zn-ribbon protein
MTIRDKANRQEKAGWVALITLFVYAEIRILYINDAEQAAKFEAIAKDLATTNAGLEATKTALEATKTGMQNANDRLIETKGRLEATSTKLDRSLIENQKRFDATMHEFIQVENQQRATEGQLQGVSQNQLRDMSNGKLKDYALDLARQLERFSSEASANISWMDSEYQKANKPGETSPEELEKLLEDKSESFQRYVHDAIEMMKTVDLVRNELLRRVGALPEQEIIRYSSLSDADFQHPGPNSIYNLSAASAYLENMANALPKH